jgi:tetratricopeptide (TPR) repeat protein
VRKSEYERIVELFGLVPVQGQDAPRQEEAAPDASSVELGERSMRQGDYSGAARHFARALDEGAQDEAAARISLAGAYECLEQAPAALRQYRRAARLHRQDPEPHVGLADIKRRHGHARDGIRRLEEAIRLAPENPFLHAKLAEALRAIGLCEQALQAAQRTVLFAPDQAFYHYWTGDLLIQMRRFPEALEALHAAVELSPGDDVVLARAAVAFWGAGLREEAVKAARLAAELNAARAAYDGLARAYLAEMGRTEEAAALTRGDPAGMDPYDKDLLRRMLADAGLAPGAGR